MPVATVQCDRESCNETAIVKTTNFNYREAATKLEQKGWIERWNLHFCCNDCMEEHFAGWLRDHS